jgi:modulator of smoothened protein
MSINYIVTGQTKFLIFVSIAGDTKLGLMWTCMTLYNRPQVCFTPDLQIEWLLALICIFIGCVCVTTTIILLVASHWDRNVIPYARWVGFTASKHHKSITQNVN